MLPWLRGNKQEQSTLILPKSERSTHLWQEKPKEENYSVVKYTQKTTIWEAYLSIPQIFMIYKNSEAKESRK